MLKGQRVSLGSSTMVCLKVHCLMEQMGLGIQDVAGIPGKKFNVSDVWLGHLSLHQFASLFHDKSSLDFC